ncbi:MAG: hypothetical protein ACI88A_002246 [Paraglaciecola sp.]|jgi:hypothetical protein
MSKYVDRFIQEYSQAHTQKDVERIASFYLLPTVILSGQTKTISNNQSEVEATISRLINAFNNDGIEKYVARTNQTIYLSDTLIIINFIWQFWNNQEQLCFECAATYTLKKMDNEELKIIAAVLNGEEALTNFLKSKG